MFDNTKYWWGCWTAEILFDGSNKIWYSHYWNVSYKSYKVSYKDFPIKLSIYTFYHVTEHKSKQGLACKYLQAALFIIDPN